MLLKTAKRKTRGNRELNFEGLESRIMLAANIDGNGNLTIDGTSGNDQIAVVQIAGPITVVVANSAVLATNNAAASGAIGATGFSFAAFTTAVNNLNINGLNGNDTISTGAILGGSPGAGTTTAVTVAGELNINLGEGTNTGIVFMTTVGTVGQQEALRVFGGSAADTVVVANSTLNEDLNIRTFGGNDVVGVGGIGAGFTRVQNDAEIFTGDGNDVIGLGFGGAPDGLRVGTGAITPDSLVVNGESGNDIVAIIAPGIGPAVAGGLSQVTILGGSNGAAPGDVIVNPAGGITGATNVNISEFETVV
jgi:hypothetical protein